MVILDTGFLSSFFKIRKLELILKALGVKYLLIPATVYEELKEAKFFQEASNLFSFEEQDLNENRFVLVKNIDLSELKNNFFIQETSTLGCGELGCFILAEKSQEIILIDDQKAKITAKDNGLKEVSIPAFLLYCKRRNIVSLEEMKQIINDLREKDYYEFSDESSRLLLE